MPRIPDAELERLKREVSLERLALARGVTLTRSGKDLRGLCPFHLDTSPSFVIDTAKNLWHCFGACSSGGSTVDFVMQAEKVGFRHAIELLKSDLPGLLDASRQVGSVRPSPARRLPSAVSLTGADTELLGQVTAYYHKRLQDSPRALAYLTKRGLASREMIEHFRIGFSDRTLGLTIPPTKDPKGATLRERLGALGVINQKTGHELLRGCITVPITTEPGEVLGLYGRRIGEGLRPNTAQHLYLPGAHKGVFNITALASSEEIVLCEAPLDALTLWAAGYKNVTTSYGVNGFQDIHREALRRYRTRRVLIAYDNDEAGNAAAEGLAAELMAAGIECFRVRLPRGMDVNEYALKVTPATKSLGIALRRAEWLGKGTPPEPASRAPHVSSGELPPASAAPASDSSPAPEAGNALFFAAEETPTAPRPEEVPPAAPLPIAPAEGVPPAVPPASKDSSALVEPPTPYVELAKKKEPIAPPPEPPEPRAPNLNPVNAGPGAPPTRERVPPAASPLPPPPAATLGARVAGGEVVIPRGDRRYRARGLAKNATFDALRVNLMVSSEAGFHVDTLDLLAARQRAAFEKAASGELGTSEETIHQDLGQVLRELEALQYAALQKALEPPSAAPAMSEADREEALALLTDPHLLDRIVADFQAAGVVGEENNTLVGYLATVSRKFKKPLAVILQSTSSAGKSTLMDAILDFVPSEERVKFSAMTGQALFYMGQTNLAHKVLAVVEEEGAERASYALKLLQSEGELSIASTGKEPATGLLVTHEYRVQGPVMILLTTTAVDIDEELQNRALILTVNEDREQTRKIQLGQRYRRTLEGLLADKTRQALCRLHQNAQRLLKSLPVALRKEDADRLSFPDERTRTRRDHEKYLTLIEALTLLHQYQRPLEKGSRNGQTLTYLEATGEDIECATRLAHEVLGRSLDELPPQTRRLLGYLDALVTQGSEHLECDRSAFHFARRELREYTGWSDFQIRTHLDKLTSLEYVLVHRGSRGQSFVYELLYHGQGTDGRPFLMGLAAPERLGTPQAPEEQKFEGSGTEFEPRGSEFEPSSSPQRAPMEPPSRPGNGAEDPHPQSSPAPSRVRVAEKAYPGPLPENTSYSPRVAARSLAGEPRGAEHDTRQARSNPDPLAEAPRSARRRGERG